MRMKEIIMTKGELALMGKAVECTSNDEAVAIIDFILNVMWSSYPYLEEVDGEDVLKKHINRYGENTVKYIVTNKLMDEFNCITFVLDNDEEPFPEDIATPDGVFCYVYNINAPELSELGYCFFEKRADNFYHRIG